MLLYIAVSLPVVQEALKNRAVKELSAFLGSRVEVGSLSISPFNKVVLADVVLFTPQEEECLRIDKVGAGIDLWRLIADGKIHVTYGEIYGMDARIWQEEPGAPLNIQFLIDAFKPKEPNKPPAKFDVRLSSIVIRGSRVSYDKRWMPRTDNPRRIDFNHLAVEKFQADISIPRMKNDDFLFDVRRLALRERSGFELKNLSCQASLTAKELQVKNLKIELPHSTLEPEDIVLTYPAMNRIGDAVKDTPHRFVLTGAQVTPSDLQAFFPPLGVLKSPCRLDIDVEGDMENIDVRILKIYSADNSLDIEMKGKASQYTDPDLLKAEVKSLYLFADFLPYSVFFNSLASEVPGAAGAIDAMRKIGSLKLKASGMYRQPEASIDADIETPLGSLDITAAAKGSIKGKTGTADIQLHTDGLQLASVLPQIGIEKIAIDGDIRVNIANSADAIWHKAPSIDGDVEISVPLLVYKGTEFSGATLSAQKRGGSIGGNVAVNSAPATLDVAAEYTPSSLRVDADIDHFIPSAFALSSNPHLNVHGRVEADLQGSTPGNMTGDIVLHDCNVQLGPDKSLGTDYLSLSSIVDDAGKRTLSLNSEFIRGEMTGHFDITRIPSSVMAIAYSVAPSWLPEKWGSYDFRNAGIDAHYDFTLLDNNRLLEFFNIPVKLLTAIPITGDINTDSGLVALNMDIPYIQQGAKTLIHNTRLNIGLDGSTQNGGIDLSTVLLGKNDDISFSLNVSGLDDALQTDISWDFNRKRAYKGKVKVKATVSDDVMPGVATPMKEKTYSLKVIPSTFQVNDTTWTIAAGDISYNNKTVDVRGVSAYHEEQFVSLNGRASATPGDTIYVGLRDIDLDYIFETLRINYVNFGGSATGTVKATDVFTKNPVAFTDNLFVRGLKYNGAVLGDGKLKSRWLNDEKEVTIFADIAERGRRTVLVDGGIWVTRDSLSISFDADRVNAAFMAPFFEAFASDISGRASGQVKLYGTFADINLIGKAKGDSIGLKVNYTNTKYFGSDSVIMTPGKIHIPGFRIYDKNGNSGVLSGTVDHYYFHEPKFEFVVKDCKNLLCFDTDDKINPRWYGTIYGNGGGTIKGVPGYVGITVDMATAPGTSFTFVLDETLEAIDYQFLTFTDKKKEARLLEEASLVEEDELTAYIKSFKKKVHEEEQVRESIFAMDLRGTINPDAKMTLIMDPVAGDKIVCRGDGSMNIGYSSENDDFTMFGKYTISEGTYNFSLQDLILKDFNIRQGSNISFNGDPYNAQLDIAAIYKVNTNLADLDKSFATDRELNRTNVPVDAVLKVNGTLQSPDISFDIELPTLTQDVARKVKSIISTDDMMSMQMIYLLALGRFYAPEYMNSGESGGEFTAIASTTLSSQLSSMLSQLSNKVSVSPSFRSDKGDFSDFEFDLGLSSRLFNNRLLINGNFGYRDKNTSSTTFIGDFDLEYLLNRSGTLRLKAYNHFNDQNYYLKSALTTQGVGIMLKRDFDRFSPLGIFRKKKSSAKEEEKEEVPGSEE